MQYARNEERGLLRYDGNRRLFTPDCCLSFSNFVTYCTKAEAVAAARRLLFTASHVERIDSRFWSGCGIRRDHRERFFLAIYG